MPFASEGRPVEVTWPAAVKVERTYDDGRREQVVKRLRGRIRIGWKALDYDTAAALVRELQDAPVMVVPRTRRAGDPDYLDEVELACHVTSDLPTTASLASGFFPVEAELETAETYDTIPGTLRGGFYLVSTAPS